MPNQKIKIPLSENDLVELLHDERVFNWSFQTEKGEFIDVELYRDDDENCEMKDEEEQIINSIEASKIEKKVGF